VATGFLTHSRPHFVTAHPTLWRMQEVKPGRAVWRHVGFIRIEVVQFRFTLKLACRVFEVTFRTIAKGFKGRFVAVLRWIATHSVCLVKL